MKYLISILSLMLVTIFLTPEAWACTDNQNITSKGGCITQKELQTLTIQEYLSQHRDFEYVKAKVYIPCPPCPEGVLCEACIMTENFLLKDETTGTELALNSIELTPPVKSYMENIHKPGDVLTVRIRDNHLNKDPVIIDIILPK